HYRRKENLLFPYLEKHGITGPPAVMWGKHDEAREHLSGAIEALKETAQIAAGEAKTVIDLVLQPAWNSIEEMIYKEEQILFPMCLDTLSEEEWYHINNQSLEIGFCLYDPQVTWKPSGVTVREAAPETAGRIQLPSGSMTPDELTAILNTIPFDLTFVDKNDTVRYFTQGKERIFERNRAILGRQVQLCHPPSSVHIVQKILDDFHSGKQERAAFHINMKGRFISIEYFALRSPEGKYLGTLEVSQDLTEKRALQGEKRILSYEEEVTS
ncbi:MAG: PAS domain-containing protein, partial [Candidatus Zixiibacteriota bacterium]